MGTARAASDTNPVSSAQRAAASSGLPFPVNGDILLIGGSREELGVG